MIDNKLDFILVLAGEECAELQQCFSKIMRFGIDDLYNGSTNKQRLITELIDFGVVLDLLIDELGIENEINDSESFKNKLEKIRKYLEYSKSVGKVARLVEI